MFYKINYFTLLLCLIAFFNLSCKKNEPTNSLDKIVIIKSETSIRSDKVEMGIIDQLNIDGIKLDIITYNARGNEESLISALNEAKTKQPLAIITISKIPTMTLLSLLKTNNTIYFGIFNVDEINQIHRANNRYNNIKGVYKIENMIPYVKKIKTTLYEINRIGYLYNVNNIKSTKKAKHLRKIFRKEGLEYIGLPIVNESDIINNYSNIISKIDAIYLDSDKLTLNAIEYINSSNNKYLPPLITTHTRSSYDNILLSININYYRVGRMLADIIVELKEKRSLDKITNRTIKVEDNFDIYINKTVLDNSNIKINTNNLGTNTKIIYVENSF